MIYIIYYTKLYYISYYIIYIILNYILYIIYVSYYIVLYIILYYIILYIYIYHIKYNIEELRLILKKRENFWILNLRTLYPDGLNQELNKLLRCRQLFNSWYKYLYH